MFASCSPWNWSPKITDLIMSTANSLVKGNAIGFASMKDTSGLQTKAALELVVASPQPKALKIEEDRNLTGHENTTFSTRVNVDQESNGRDEIIHNLIQS